MKTSTLILLLILLLPISFLGEALMVQWFFWALHETDYVDHTLDFGGACTIAAPLWVGTLLSLIGRSS